jgi:hypothetical protein
MNPWQVAAKTEKYSSDKLTSGNMVMLTGALSCRKLMLQEEFKNA